MDEKILEIAKQAALEAGKIIKKYYLSKLKLQSKGHFTDFATKADIESERIIIEIIKNNFPDHNIIAEESGAKENGSQYTWAVDPIDGTIPFVDGLPVFGVSIGILKEGKPIIGVINMVATGELYFAVDGKGAFLGNKKIKVRKENTLEKATIGMDLGHTERAYKIDRFIKPICEKVRYVYLFGSAVAVFCYVAKGIIDAYIIKANIWDIAAGVVLVKEAGGKVTDMAGYEPDYMNGKPSIVASNGLIHDQVLEVYK